ncbi:hypothetical protein OAQ84_01870 [Bdellovibrionales bacterium]|nr:hypothetical protein [Bdellovibrionales bacterium]
MDGETIWSFTIFSLWQKGATIVLVIFRVSAAHIIDLSIRVGVRLDLERRRDHRALWPLLLGCFKLLLEVLVLFFLQL